MLNMMSYHLNKHVLVSIPGILGDGPPRRCLLTGIEPFGLWLENEELFRLAFSDDKRPSTIVFVPFTQIAYLVAAPVAPVAGPVAESPAKPRRKTPVRPPR